MIWLLVLISATIISTASSSLGYDHVYCVLPVNGTQPCQKPCESCHTLSYYTSHVTQYFTSDTMIKFVSGVHLLQDNTSVLIRNVKQLALVGDINDDNDIIIQCDSGGSSGFIVTNSTDVRIQNLTFLNCGQELTASFISTVCSDSCYAALAVDTINTLLISGINVSNSHGWGLYAMRVFGSSALVDSVLSHNFGTLEYDGGNVAFVYTNCSADNVDTVLSLKSLEILYGYSSHRYSVAPGLCLFLECTRINVSISDVKMIGNVANSTTINTGGNIAIIYRNYTDLIVNFVIMQNCYIADGVADQGAGMYVSILEASPVSTFSANNKQTVGQFLHVSNTQFIGNHARDFAGGVFIIVHEMPYVYGVTGELIFENCNFLNNTLLLSPKAKWDGGIAVHINNHNVPEYLLHGVPQFNISFVGCNFSRNYLIDSNHCPGSATVFIIRNPPGTHFTNCTFEDNSCSALAAVQSVIVFHGSITMLRNSGTDGGGLALCDRSYMYLTPHTNVTFDSNHAWHSGGAIYSEDECLQSIPLCFFQLDETIIVDINLLSTVHITMMGNTAAYAGSALYGGSIDYCYVPGVGSHLLPEPSGPQIFTDIFHITHSTTDLSYISSNPTDLCFCDGDNMMTPNCNITTFNATVFPGKTFNLSVLVVGQKNGAVPGDILANFSKSGPSLEPLQYVQTVSTTTCSVLKYTVFSSDGSEVIYLKVQRPGYSSDSYFHPSQRQIELSLKTCPQGFTLDHAHPYCDCVHLLAVNNISCNITSETIHRPVPVWIGFHSDNSSTSNTGLIFHNHCPFDFCLPNDVDIHVTNLIVEEDEQCAVGRTGILCGACKEGLSLALGTSKCIPCTNYWLLLLVAFAFAGAALVFLLITCNLTVTEGTISGLIFYANIVQINRAIFFPHKNIHILNDFLEVFIAWLNLDLGIQTCLYNGMDAYVKTWLQFAFPVYIWLITLLIIYLSRQYRKVASLIGRNAVKVLATLLLLSYAKLLRAIMAALSVTFITYPNNSIKALWLHDANIQYLHGKHIPLFIVALLFGMVSLPYVLTLLFISILKKYSHLKIFSWVEKLKPILDAYIGPYKDKYRFWTGLLLLLRCILFTTFELNILGTPGVNLLAIAVACMCILPLIRGVYRKWPLDILEFSFIINLGIFSVATAYVLNNGGNQTVVASISTMIAFVIFIGILLWHARTCRVGKWLLKQMGTEVTREPVQPTNVDNIVKVDEELEYREPLLAHENA